MKWPWHRHRNGIIRHQIEAAHREADELKRATEEQEDILREALRRRDASVERAQRAVLSLERTLSRAFRNGFGDG